MKELSGGPGSGSGPAINSSAVNSSSTNSSINGSANGSILDGVPVAPVIQEGQIHNLCPVDFRPLAKVKTDSPETVSAVVDHARNAQVAWDSLGFEKRARLMKLAGKEMLKRRQEVLELLHNETGKTPPEILLSEAIGPLQYISEWVKVARPWLKTRKLGISPLAFPGKKGVIEMLPRGVVGIITSWNYPLGNFFKPVFAALLCGNTVVIKPSEYSPRTAEWFKRIMDQYLPQGVVNTVQGDGQIGQALLGAGIDAITFTGSFKTGKIVAGLAAEQMIPCSVELGGKDAALVLRDCEMDRTVAGIMHWALHNSGQACGDIERVYVEDAIADEFVGRLSRAVSKLRVQSGQTYDSDVGPTVHSAQFNIINEHVKDAQNRGAKILCGGKPTGKGLWFEPTVLDHCNHSMVILREPTFGPVIPIVRVKNADEGVALINDSEYGLNASVWSGDGKRAREIARKLLAGTVFVNNHAFTGAIPAAPWTGVKKSGHGVANSIFSLSHYTRPRSVVVDTKKTADAWWFPMDAMAEKLGQCLAEAQLGNLKAAIQIPVLIFKRQKSVLEFARASRLNTETGAQIATSTATQVAKKHAESEKSSGFIVRKFIAGIRFLTPPLFSFELEWGAAAIEGIFSGSNTRNFKLLPRSEEKEFLKDFYKNLPFPANLGVRLSFWFIGLAPFYKLGKWKTMERLSVKERLALLEKMDASRSYLERQLVMMFKMNGALSHMSTKRFHKLTSELPTQPPLPRESLRSDNVEMRP